MSETGKYIKTLQTRICNQRTELENLHRVIERDNSLISILKDANQREYRLGYEAGVEELAVRLENYYLHLTGDSFTYLIAHHIKTVKKEILEKNGREEN